MVDGIDGAGKSTVIDHWADYLEQQEKRVFDLKKYWKENDDFPEYQDLQDYDVILSAEPTYTWVGGAIRGEIVQRSSYSANAAVQAFALDRQVLYKRIIVPALKDNKTIIQDRGVSTSLCYQTIQSKEFDIEDIAEVEGNKFALENRPDYLVLLDVDIKEALDRLNYREDKQDDSHFEKKEFLKKARTQFFSERYQNLFKKQGAEIKKLDCNQEIGIIKEKSITFLKNLK